MEDNKFMGNNNLVRVMGNHGMTMDIPVGCSGTWIYDLILTAEDGKEYSFPVRVKFTNRDGVLCPENITGEPFQWVGNSEQ
jgi:hypothetical protein